MRRARARTSAELRKHVAKEIGPIAKPRSILVVAELPKTRSGKIMRRLLRDIAEGRETGDVTTLADSSVMDQITKGMQRVGHPVRPRATTPGTTGTDAGPLASRRDRHDYPDDLFGLRGSPQSPGSRHLDHGQTSAPARRRPA